MLYIRPDGVDVSSIIRIASFFGRSPGHPPVLRIRGAGAAAIARRRTMDVSAKTSAQRRGRSTSCPRSSPPGYLVLPAAAPRRSQKKKGLFRCVGRHACEPKAGPGGYWVVLSERYVAQRTVGTHRAITSHSHPTKEATPAAATTVELQPEGALLPVRGPRSGRTRAGAAGVPVSRSRHNCPPPPAVPSQCAHQAEFAIRTIRPTTSSRVVRARPLGVFPLLPFLPLLLTSWTVVRRDRPTR